MTVVREKEDSHLDSGKGKGGQSKREEEDNSLDSPVPFGLEASHSRTTMTMTTKLVKEVTSIIGLMGRRMDDDDDDNKTREGSHIHNWIDGQAHGRQ